MVDLVMNKPREFHGAAPPGSIVKHVVDADTELFVGAALMHADAGGALVNATPTAGGFFAGFCIEQVDNKAGSLAGGGQADAHVQVQMRGLVWLDVTPTGTWGYDDVGLSVFASDSDTFTNSAGTNNIAVGRVIAVPQESVGFTTAARVLVHFEATAMRSL